MAFEGIHIALTEESIYKVFLIRPNFSQVNIEVASQNYIIPQGTETKTPYTQYGAGAGYFIGENYKIQPLSQPDAEIQAVTTWTPATIKTYAQLVAQAAASPGAGLQGHIELVYHNSTPGLHNIMYIEINVTAIKKKKIYCFNVI